MADWNSKPETAAEALALWDADEIVWTVEMGGLGPGYEQVIHIMAFEIIRELLKHEPIAWTKADDEHRAEWRAFRDVIEAGVNPRIMGLGSTGAQFGAAQNIAYRTVRVGWRKALDELPGDRLIQVSRAWPRLDASQTPAVA